MEQFLYHYNLKQRTPVHNLQSQSVFRDLWSMLPTSLTYIILSARGDQPRRPDAVMGTDSSGQHYVLFIMWVTNHAPDTSECNVLYQ